MGETGNISHITGTDPEILEGLGHRLRAHRKARRLTLLQAAERTGLSPRTVHRAESGKNPTLLTLIRLLRLYGDLGSLDGVLREPEVSPMAMLEKRRETPRG